MLSQSESMSRGRYRRIQAGIAASSELNESSNNCDISVFMDRLLAEISQNRS